MSSSNSSGWSPILLHFSWSAISKKNACKYFVHIRSISSQKNDWCTGSLYSRLNVPQSCSLSVKYTCSPRIRAGLSLSLIHFDANASYSGFETRSRISFSNMLNCCMNRSYMSLESFCQSELESFISSASYGYGFYLFNTLGFELIFYGNYSLSFDIWLILRFFEGKLRIGF